MKQNARILLVDDSPEILEFLDTRLRTMGFRTSVLRDGGQALEAAKAEHPDLVVLDVMMPEVNGYQTCRELKRLNPAIRVLMLTAKSSPADRFWAKESGADEFVTKPVDPQLVAQRVVALLSESP